MWPWRRSEPVSSFDTRPPAAHEHLLDTLAPLCNLAALQSIDTRHQAGVLDHEGHELSGVAPDAEELEAILLDERLKGRMGGDADSVAVCVLEDLAEGDKGLDVTSRANNLDDDVELRGRGLTRLATKTRGDVGRRQSRFDGDLARERRGEQISESPILSVDVDVDSSIGYSV